MAHAKILLRYAVFFVFISLILNGSVYSEENKGNAKSLFTSVISVGRFLDGAQENTGFIGCSALNIGKHPVDIGIFVFKGDGKGYFNCERTLQSGESSFCGFAETNNQTAYCEIKVFEGNSKGVRGTLTWFEENPDGSISPKVTSETR
jgi:hypothetical protein